MKYVKNGINQNIIKDSDINLSESFQNQNLAQVLTEYRKDLDTLKSNVKWLAKYGGVGGSGVGGSSSSNTKLKYKVDVRYINNAGILTAESFASKTTSNNIIAQQGSRATISITLLRCLPNTDYVVKILYGEESYTLYVNSLTLTISQNITCVGNAPLNILVYASPEDMPETVINFYTVAKQASLNLKLDNGVIISNGNTVLANYVQKDETKIIGTLINYLPSMYEGSFLQFTVNGQNVPFETNQSLGESGEIITLFQIPVKNVFSNFGIYEVQINYVYNGVEEFIKNIYIYKDHPVFLYCYGETNTVYAGITPNPHTSNYSVETIKYRIYPEEGLPSNQAYSGSYKIEYEGKPQATLEEPFYKESNKNWEIRFLNIYSKDDFTFEGQSKQIKITFTINEYSFTYYVYVHKISDINYIFTHIVKNGDTETEELFYNADHSCTATANEDKNPNTEFPFVNGLFKKLLTSETYPIKRIASKTSLLSAVSVYGTRIDNVLTGGYVTNFEASDSAVDADVLISFGLKYSEYNLDLPIVTINVDVNSSITLYSNKIVYGNNQYTRWFIPNDGQYHLILLYYKPRYTIDGASCTSAAPDFSSAFIWCIDGVIETQPIFIDRSNTLVTFIKDISSITYHPGNWDFNFLGLATFNAKPKPDIWESFKTKFEERGEILRYALDFDPIIPANYYQAYYLFLNRESLSHTFDQGIYTNLFSNNSNNKFGINYYKNYNKFIASDIVALGKLTNLPIYIIDPVASKAPESTIEMNDFLHKTYAGGYNETSLPPGIECAFKKATIVGEELKEEYLVNDTKYKFFIEYQGSSTLKYGVKNFEISALEYSEEGSDEVNKTILWTPDENVFLPEKSFTLKADVVDSSHSNNVIVGKFVNDYMKASAFNENCKTCLEGFPILLFMRDTVDSTSVDIPDNPIFLGIYSFNLGRKSLYNLGYKTLNTDKCVDISVSNSTSRAYILLNDDAIIHPYKYRVAEVQGNSPALYDYSLYDYLLLSNKMLGDFFNYNGAAEDSNFSSDFQRPFIGLNKLIFHNFVGDLETNYKSYDFKENELTGYYSPINKSSLFNVLQLNFNYKDRYPVLDTYYYKTNATTVLPVPSDGLVLDFNQIEGIKPYLTLANDMSIIGNPLYQFHLICNNAGEPSSTGYYYVEKLQNNPTDFNTDSDDYFDYDTLLRYYIVCMLFAMVDSVLKNLTIRCKNFNPQTSNSWLVGFYDMDTSFGVDNIGNAVDFKAFSDYILQSGKIVSDYFDGNAATSEGSGFDVPSSFLFLAAKYLNILTQPGVNAALGEREFISHKQSSVLKTPFNYWLALRYTLLADVDTFFANYVDNHFKEVNPLIWNLNYMYKYFSASGTTGNDDDTEQSKFNGTRRYSRKNWLKQRLEVIDVLFGIRNNHPISNSDSLYICKQQADDNISEQLSYSGFLDSVPIASTMFPCFSKGIGEVDINASVTSYPKAPVVLQTTNSDYRLYLADNAGKISGIKGHVTSNVDIGFYGTTNLKSLNECGLFLWDSSGNKQNTIINNIIQNIVIDRCPANGNQPISLDLNNLASVNSIRVNAEGTSAKKYKGSLFIITINKDRIIDEIVFNHCKFSDTIAITGNGATLTVKKLTITNCECNHLKLEGVNIQTLVLKDCNIKQYTLSGEFPNLNITDGSANDILIRSTVKNIEVSLNMPSLQSLTLQGAISKFNNNDGAPNCTNVLIENLSSQNTLLILKGLTNYDKEIAIKLNNTVSELSLQCSNNKKCIGYKIIQPKTGNNYTLNKVNLLADAFRNNLEIEYISFGDNSSNSELINQIPVNIKGDYVFYDCRKLFGNYCIPQKANMVTLTESSHKYMYCNNSNLTIGDVIKFFNYVTKIKSTIDLSYLFSACKGIIFNVTKSGNNYNKPSLYNLFVTSLTLFVTNVSCNFTNIFAETKFNFLDATLVGLFKNNNSLPDICPACTIENEKFIYVTYDFLQNNPNITQLTLGNRFGHLGYVCGETLTKVLISNDNNYTLAEYVDIYELLNNGNLSEILGIHLYTSDINQVDCTHGLPSSVTKLKFFNSTIHKYNFNNLENLFDNSSNCEVYMDIFFGGNKINLDNRINIFNLFWRLIDNEDGSKTTEAKVILKLHESTKLTTKEESTTTNRGSNSISYSLNFDKICTQSQFKLIMLYLVDLLLNYLETGIIPDCSIYNQIPGLFLNCIITKVTDFESLITADDGKSYFTVRAVVDESSKTRDINFIDLERTFSFCKLLKSNEDEIAFIPELMWQEFKLTEDSDDIYKTKIINLKRTFYSTFLQKITRPLNIRWVQNMNLCFYDCTYEVIESDDSPVIIADPTSGVGFKFTWSWKDNFPILPAKFFDGFSNCDVTQCFYNSDIKRTNIQGQLPKTKDDVWWKEGEVNLSTVSNMFYNALLHPIKEVETEDKVNYYIYPKAYTDVFSSSENVYQHVILPLTGDVDSNQTLFLFQDSTTLLNFKNRLPRLPNDNSSSYYATFLSKKPWRVKINKQNTFMNNSSLMSSSNYKNFLPTSLFLVLNQLQFKNYNMTNSKPILYNEGYAYYGVTECWDINQTTPGGIAYKDLPEGLKNVIV